MHTDEHRSETESDLNQLTRQVIGAAYAVMNALGTGFLEKVYENALALELRGQCLQVAQQHPVKVWYRNEVVGEYFADLIVEDTVLVELKAAAGTEPHVAQCLNYLRATRLPVCLLLNFGRPQLEVKRLML